MAFAVDTGPVAAEGRGARRAVLVVGRDRSFVAEILAELALQSVPGEATSPGAAASSVRAARPALVVVLLDSFDDGPEALAACAAIRASTPAPMIAVGTPPGGVDAVELLRVVDDVVRERGRVREAVARVRALLRRIPEPRARASGAEVVEVGDVSLDVERHVVTVRGQPVHLPLKQFLLLELLLRNAGQVLPKTTIEERVWGASGSVASNTLEVQVKRLRAVVERDPSSPELIRTVRGLGYLFERPSRGSAAPRP